MSARVDEANYRVSCLPAEDSFYGLMEEVTVELERDGIERSLVLWQMGLSTGDDEPMKWREDGPEPYSIQHVLTKPPYVDEGDTRVFRVEGWGVMSVRHHYGCLTVQFSPAKGVSVSKFFYGAPL